MAEDEESAQDDEFDGNVHAEAEAFPEGDDSFNNVEDEEPVPNKKLPGVPIVPTQTYDQEEEPQVAVAAPPRRRVSLDEDEEPTRVRARGGQPNPFNTYFPVSFGSTNGGAIAIANSYSTGKGGTASSRATAYGSGTKSKKRSNQE